MIAAMEARRPLIEGCLWYGAALAAVWLWREGLVMSGEDAVWLIPLTWIAASVLATWPTARATIDLFTVRQWFGAPWETAKVLLVTSGVVLPLFSLVYLGYWGWGAGRSVTPTLPPSWGQLWWYQLVYVGFPEELFFRGYLQQRFDELFGRPSRFLGAPWGAGLVMANLLFTAGHVLVTGDVARLDVFFPGLLFGWLLARTGSLLAPMLFHGMCNVLLFTLQALVTA
jgi:membrane protease YdiL (CAAX protease family)